MQGTWSEVLLAGKTVEIYEPAGAPQPRFGVVFLHPLGLETLRDRPAFTRVFDERRIVCVCPHVQRSWWTGRVCSEFDANLTAERHVVDNVLPFMQSRWKFGPRAVGLFGISMGGQGALRLAFRYPKLFPVAAGIASALDYHERYGEGTPLDEMYDSREQCRQDTALMHVPPYDPPPHLFFCIDPDDAEWLRGNDRLREKMSALGVPHTIDFTTAGGGHAWDYFNRMAEPTLRFVAEALEKESRRLL